MTAIRITDHPVDFRFTIVDFRKLIQANHFTAKPAEIAKAHPISEDPRDSTVQNFPDPLSDIHSRRLEIPGVTLRALRPLRFKCNVGVEPGYTIGTASASSEKPINSPVFK
jgi:hypothetical protein